MVVEIRSKISKAIGIKVPASAVFDYPNIFDMSRYLLNSISLDFEDKKIEKIDSQEMETLADDDILALLDEELAIAKKEQK